MKVLRMMIYSKAKFIRGLSYVLVGVFLGCANFIFAVIALATAIVFDALATAAEIHTEPLQSGKRVKANRIVAPDEI